MESSEFGLFFHHTLFPASFLPSSNKKAAFRFRNFLQYYGETKVPTNRLYRRRSDDMGKIIEGLVITTILYFVTLWSAFALYYWIYQIPFDHDWDLSGNFIGIFMITIPYITYGLLMRFIQDNPVRQAFTVSLVTVVCEFCRWAHQRGPVCHRRRDSTKIATARPPKKPGCTWPRFLLVNPSREEKLVHVI
jgi:hypothetical protein